MPVGSARLLAFGRQSEFARESARHPTGRVVAGSGPAVVGRIGRRVGCCIGREHVFGQVCGNVLQMLAHGFRTQSLHVCDQLRTHQHARNTLQHTTVQHSTCGRVSSENPLGGSRSSPAAATDLAIIRMIFEVRFEALRIEHFESELFEARLAHCRSGD
jgi:hypothetical protein